MVLIRAVAVLDARLARQDAGARPLLPDRRARHRLRHHLLLGRAHDDDGPPLHGGGALPRRLYPRARPRREGPEDVEVEGERHRSPRPDRPIWRRCAALHPCRHGGARTRHQAQRGPRRGLPQLRDQAVERGAVHANQWLPAALGFRSGLCQAHRQSLDRRRERAHGRRRDRGARSLSASTRRPPPSITSSGMSIATGISS